MLDVGIRLLSMLSVSMPIFWLGLILQHVFFQRLGWLPVAGEYDARIEAAHPLAVYTHFTILDALISGNWAVLQQLAVAPRAAGARRSPPTRRARSRR